MLDPKVAEAVDNLGVVLTSSQGYLSILAPSDVIVMHSKDDIESVIETMREHLESMNRCSIGLVNRLIKDGIESGTEVSSS